MAKITKISASDKPRETDESEKEALVREKVKVKDKKSVRREQKERRQKEKAVSGEVGGVGKSGKSGEAGKKKPFILFRPFVAFGRYLKESWQELRQVRWPNRKTTWKMVLAVLVYTAIFMILILLLDTFFTWLMGMVLGT